MHYDYDLLIIGGGLVGNSLAVALSDLPLRFAVVETQSESTRITLPTAQRALALSRGTVQSLTTLDVWREITPRPGPICRIHVSDQRHFGHTCLEAKEQGVDALGYVTLAQALESAFERRLKSLNIDRRCPSRVVGLKSASNAVFVTLKEGDSSFPVAARLVVAADGTQSTVRRLLEIGQNVWDYDQRALITTIHTEQDTSFTAYERFTVSGPLACLPLDSHHYSVIWTLPPDRADERCYESESEFLSHFQATLGHWIGNKITLTSERRTIPLQKVCAKKMVDDRVVLIGNAMHQIHPVAGQGFNLGIRDAFCLAERLAAQLAFKGDIGEAAFLSRYAAARQSDLHRVMYFTDSLVKIFSNDFLPVVLARNAALSVLERTPFAKRWLTQYAMGYGARW